MSDRGYPHGGDFWPGIAGQAERGALQDSNHLYHRTRRRKNADAGVASRRRGVHGKTVRRRSSARECSSSSGELIPIRKNARERKEASVGAFERFGSGDQDRNPRRFEQVIGSSPALEAVLEQVERVAPTDSTVLIQG